MTNTTDPLHERVPRHREVALFCLRANRPVKRAEVAQRFGLSRNAVARVFRQLREREDCYRLGEAETGFVRVLAVRDEVAADRPSRSRALARFALEHGGEITVQQACARLALDELQALNALRNMRHLNGVECCTLQRGKWRVRRIRPTEVKPIKRQSSVSGEEREEALALRANAWLRTWR